MFTSDRIAMANEIGAILKIASRPGIAKLTAAEVEELVMTILESKKKTSTC